MTDYGWFLKAQVPSEAWRQVTETAFPAKGHRARLKYVVLEQFEDAYDVEVDEAASRLRGILALNVKTGWVYQHDAQHWFLVATDDVEVQHRFLVDAQGTILYYAPPSWEERMGIPVPVGDAIPIEEFRNIDTSRVVATRNTLKRTYGRLYPELNGTRSLTKMEHLRKSLAEALIDGQILHNAQNPQAYLVVEADREVIWVVRTDGLYVFRIFAKAANPNIYQNVLRF